MIYFKNYYYNNILMLRIILLITFVFLSGCVSAPKNAQDITKKTFMGNSPCAAMFLNNGLGRTYQRMNMFTEPGKPTGCGDVSVTSFALAKDINGEVCGWSDRMDIMDAKGKSILASCKGAYTQEELDAHAIGKCEVTKIELKSLVQAPCKIYARGNSIVWEKEDGEALDFD